MCERELPNLWGVGDHLIADVAKTLHVVDEIFCLVVPTEGANYSLLDSQSLRIVEALTWRQGPAKQTGNPLSLRFLESPGVSAASLMLKSDREIERVSTSIFQ